MRAVPGIVLLAASAAAQSYCPTSLDCWVELERQARLSVDMRAAGERAAREVRVEFARKFESFAADLSACAEQVNAGLVVRGKRNRCDAGKLQREFDKLVGHEGWPK